MGKKHKHKPMKTEKRFCEQCKKEFDGTKKARYCKTCRTGQRSYAFYY